MRRLLFAALAALWIVTAPAHAKHTTHHNRMKQYRTEHAARMHRHRTLTPAQRHARMMKYRAEHRARQHRHRAHLRAQRMKH
jgi:hypothetical protein